jgi:hypothetical protein
MILSGLAWLYPAEGQTPPASAPASAVPLRAGATLDSVLAALNARGHRIVYSNALVTPMMTLRATPRATRIDDLLAEILAPWRLRAIAAENGDWLIVAAGAAPPTTSVEIDMPPEPAQLQVIDVTASRYALATPGSSAVFLDRRGVEQMPHLADDAVRMLKVLPGVSGGDFSAALNIRGGRREETMLRIDGAEIHNGFHFRDLTGALSVLDTTLVDNIDFVTGGMTVRHGDALSGLVDMRTRRPRAADEYRSAAGVSFVSAYARTGSAFAGDRGAWLISARRGYLDLVMKRVQENDEQITPRYTDVFASLFHDFSEATTLAVHALLGEDDLRLVSRENDDIDSAGQGRAGHAWLTLDHRFGDRLQSSTLASVSSVRQWRKASGSEEYRANAVDADFRFRFLDLRSDWTWSLSDAQMLLFGADAGRSQADYAYSLSGDRMSSAVPGTREVIDYSHDLDLRGTRLGVHAAWRARIADLVVEAGARRDEYRYPAGLRFSAVSPRLNALYGIGKRGELRAAAGIAYQPQGLDELQVEDDVTAFYPPERVRQVVLGYLHRFDRGLSARLDVYRKDYSRLRPRFENALDPVQLIPEGSIDRVRIDAPRARARGVELTVRREAERGLAGWASVTVAKAEDDVTTEGWTPRLWDQRHSVSLGLSWTGAKWNLNLAGLHHGGTPTTRLRPAFVTLPGGERLDLVVADERNGERLGQYARLDLRATRAVQLRNARLSYYLEATNLLNRANPCCVEEWHLQPGEDGRPRLVVEQTDWLPLLPSFGFEFEF